MAYGRDYAGAAEVLQLALSKLDRLQLRPGHKLAMKVSAYNNLLGLEILRGGLDTARDLLKSHPLMAAKAEILARGHFANGNEFDFALAEEFVRLMIGDLAKTGWGDLMAMPPRWTKDPEEILDVQAFGQAAIGLQLAKAGRTDDARHELSVPPRKRLGILPGAVSEVHLRGAPAPLRADIILADFAIEATLAQPAPNYDLIVQASVLLNRTIATSADDAPHQPGHPAFGGWQADRTKPADHSVPAGRLGEGTGPRADQARPVVRRGRQGGAGAGAAAHGLRRQRIHAAAPAHTGRVD